PCIEGPRAAAAVSAVTIAVGLLVLLRYVLGWDIYFDQLTLDPMPLIAGGMPPRMAPATAVAFCCFGASLVCALRPTTPLAHQTLAILVMVLGWLGLSRYIYGGEALVPFVNMAAHASWLFL